MEILHLCQLHFHLKENQKSLFSKEAYTLDSYNQCWTSVNSSYMQGFPWWTLLHAHKELSSCTSQLWASSACLADLPCYSLRRLKNKAVVCVLPCAIPDPLYPPVLWLPGDVTLESLLAQPCKAFFLQSLSLTMEPRLIFCYQLVGGKVESLRT